MNTNELKTIGYYLLSRNSKTVDAYVGDRCSRKKCVKSNI